MRRAFTESVVEDAAHAILREALLPKLLCGELRVAVGAEETGVVA